MLDYRYRTFLALAQDLNYTKAAKQLNLTQPAVTKHIQYLEEHLNIQLVAYQNRRLVLTAKGEYLREQVSQLEIAVAETKAVLQGSTEPLTLTIGASRTIGEFCISTKMKEFNKVKGPYQTTLIVDNTFNLLKALDRQQLDVALTSGPFDTSQYEVMTFFVHPLMLVCSVTHPLAGEKIPLARLLSETIYLREEGSGVLDLLKKAFETQAYDLADFEHTVSIGNISLIKELVEESDGVSFLYEMSVAKELAQGRLAQIEIEGCGVTQEFQMVFNKTVKKTEAIKQFIKLFK